jgi:allantoicase
MNNLIMPGASTSMADGWETRRRRGPGHDWVIVKLGRAGTLSSIEIDTSHFKGNYPDECSLDACTEPTRSVDALTAPEIQWTEVLSPSKLRANAVHVFERELRARGPFTHVRLNIYPDGGVARMRVWGKILTE